MKIVSYGHIKPKTMTCSGCGAVFEYLPRDVENFRPGTRYAKNFVRCPVCGSPIFVDVTFAKNDKYVTFADCGDMEEETTVKIKDLPFMKADIKTLAHDEVHDDEHVAWQSGYLACLKACQKQVRKAAGVEREKKK